MRLIWADRIGIVWAGVVLFLAFAADGGFRIATDGTTFDEGLWYFGGWLLIFAVPPWLLLRGLDFITDGHGRRRAQRSRLG